MDNNEVKTSFSQLIETLKSITKCPSYKEGYKEYGNILSTILKWSNDYNNTNDLSKINHIELLDIYERLEDLKTKFLFKNDIGIEGELSDNATIYLWQIMILRKQQIDSTIKESDLTIYNQTYECIHKLIYHTQNLLYHEEYKEDFEIIKELLNNLKDIKKQFINTRNLATIKEEQINKIVNYKKRLFDKYLINELDIYINLLKPLYEASVNRIVKNIDDE